MSKRKRVKQGKRELPGMTFLKENKKIAMIVGAAAVVVVAAGIVIGVFAGKHTQQASSDAGESQVQTETATEQLIPLEVDAHTEINQLIAQYYQAVSQGDRAMVQTLSDTSDEESLIYMEKRSAYIEAYQDLTCYTKPGPIENSYMVYASYNVKFKDMDTLVPGVSPFLVYPREDGSYYIHTGEVDESVNDYLEVISVQDDVVDLMNQVQVKFNETVVADEDLNNFLAVMKEELKVEVGEALAEAASAETKAAEETAEEPAGEEGSSADVKEVRATDVVNVRQSDSEQAERIGKVQIGDVLPLLETKANGWSKIEFEGKEAYIKSEFLEPVAEEAENTDGDTDAGDADTQKADAGQDQEAGEDENTSSASSQLPAKGQIMVGETVNIRKSASQDAERIAVCYQGDKLEIVMQQADGWTKVKYDGKTGYVKTDVLKVME